MTDNVTNIHQPLTQDDWKFIFDVLEGTEAGRAAHSQQGVAQLPREANKDASAGRHVRRHR